MGHKRPKTSPHNTVPCRSIHPIKFLQLLLTSSNSPSEWNLHNNNNNWHRPCHKTHQVSNQTTEWNKFQSPNLQHTHNQTPIPTCCIAGRTSVVSPPPSQPGFWSAFRRPYGAYDTLCNHWDQKCIHQQNNTCSVIHSEGGIFSTTRMAMTRFLSLLCP